ncbi:Hypothetical protein A7982_05425 [Minicystis rosea]|nr:Hypothetical protein A7982_05425 [Minicystis rosea]
MRVPRWTIRATAALSEASARIRVIAANTPVNLRQELGRLAASWADTGKLAPKFVYEPVPGCGAVRHALELLAADLEPHGELGAIYAARAMEMADDASLCEHAGTAGLWDAARRRYARRDRFDDEADVVAKEWLAEETPSADDEALVRSDDERSPRSLVARMREEIGKRRLPLRVVVKDNIASLAATGDGFVQVIAGKMLAMRDVERTVLHEIEGHVEPRVAASGNALGIFAIGTARGADDQEGRALWLERANGFLDHGRRREIALRHVAARSVEARAELTDTAELLRDHGAPIDMALRVAARVHRGGGLGREVVYLPALLRVEAAIARDHAIDHVLRMGRVSVETAPTLAAWL